MLDRASFIIVPNQEVQKEALWKDKRYNNRSWFLSSMGGIPCFRKKIKIDKEIKKATITATALGIFEIYINGKRLGADELKPGFTDYRKTVYAFEYNIADYLTEGENEILAEVSTGWYNGRISGGKFGFKNNAFAAEIKINNDLYVTDENWDAAITGPYLFATIYDGVLYDANAKYGNWGKAERTDVSCEVFPAALPYIGVKSVMPAMSAIIYEGTKDNGSTYGEINIVSENNGSDCDKLTLKKGQTLLVDFEQNLVGRTHLMFNAPKGSKLTVRHAEMLNDSGEESRGNDCAKGSAYIKNYRSAVARTEYISDGKTADFAPYHTFYGFRYVEIECTEDVEITCIEAEVIGNKNREIGKFECSDNCVNKLFSNILWGARGNYLSAPTDCPQRDERLGWSGDTEVFCGAGAYLMDIEDFMRKWLHDARDCQSLEGGYGDVIPFVFSSAGNINSTAWGDAGVIVPYKMYEMYGNKKYLAEHFESMEQYMATLKTNKPEGTHNNYGDWLSYEETSKDYIRDCYYLYDLRLMAKMCHVLDKSDREDYYKSEFDRVLKGFTKNYVRSDGLTEKSQTANIIALAFGLLDTEHIAIAKQNLAEKIKNNDYTLSSGFVGTGSINQTLSAFGLDDIAYNLLLCHNDPSWLYSVDQGATTVWERWNSYTKKTGFGDVGMNSFNHYAYGAVAEWMFGYVCGIRADFEKPAFAHLIYDPRPDMRTEIPAGRDKITYAKAEYESRSGLIKSEWKALEKGFEYTLVTPVDTDVTIPAVLDTVTVNGKKVKAENADGKFVFKLKKGEYTIIA